MHGRSIAWVRDRCRLEGGTRSLLYAVATHAGKHYADCTASASTLARASGLSVRHVKRLLPELVDMGVLEQLDSGSGRRPACYRIAPPLWVEGTAEASGLVEGEASASGIVEGTSTSRSGDTMSPLEGEVLSRSGDIGNPVVVTSGFRSGDMPWPLTSTDGRQEKYVEEKGEEKNVARSRSLASARSNAAATTIDLYRAVKEQDPGATYDTGTEWSGPTITLSDGSVLPNVRRVHEWLASRESAS